MPLPILTTPRLRLREFTLDDAPFILELLNEPGFLRFIGDRGVHALDGARAYLQNGPLASYARHAFGLLCVERAETGQPVGMCGLIQRAALPWPDLGYAFLERYHGQGYAYEAAVAVRDDARARLGLANLLAVVNPANTRSIHLLEKLGMAPAGSLRLTPDEPEVALYTLDLAPRPTLDHVYWLGGSPCAGKSTLARLLAQRHRMAFYAVDEALPNQMSRLTPAHHPALTAWLRADCAGRWLRPASSLLAEVIACYTEHFSLVLEDLAQLPADRPLLVEGNSLLPGLVAPWLANTHRAAWLVPTPDFQHAYYAQREWTRDVLAGCPDPATAFANWMERDTRFAAWVQTETARLGLSCILVDGSRSLEATTSHLERHFGWEA